MIHGAGRACSGRQIASTFRRAGTLSQLRAEWILCPDSCFCCCCRLCPPAGWSPLRFLQHRAIGRLPSQSSSMLITTVGLVCFARLQYGPTCLQCHAVPAFGTTDEIEDLRKASAVEYTVAKRCAVRVVAAWRPSNHTSVRCTRLRPKLLAKGLCLPFCCLWVAQFTSLLGLQHCHRKQLTSAPKCSSLDLVMCRWFQGGENNKCSWLPG